MCFKHIESDLKLCLKIHQVVFKILNSRFMVAFPQSQFKKKTKHSKKKQTQINKNPKQTNKKPKPQQSLFPLKKTTNQPQTNKVCNLFCFNILYPGRETFTLWQKRFFLYSYYSVLMVLSLCFSIVTSIWWTFYQSKAFFCFVLPLTAFFGFLFYFYYYFPFWALAALPFNVFCRLRVVRIW